MSDFVFNILKSGNETKDYYINPVSLSKGNKQCNHAFPWLQHPQCTSNKQRCLIIPGVSRKPTLKVQSDYSERNLHIKSILKQK